MRCAGVVCCERGLMYPFPLADTEKYTTAERHRHLESMIKKFLI